MQTCGENQKKKTPKSKKKKKGRHDSKRKQDIKKYTILKIRVLIEQTYLRWGKPPKSFKSREFCVTVKPVIARQLIKGIGTALAKRSNRRHIVCYSD